MNWLSLCRGGIRDTWAVDVLGYYNVILQGFDDAVSYCVVMGLWTLSIVRRV
jgi:hypothetical protein